jgi:hypothetical protein
MPVEAGTGPAVKTSSPRLPPRDAKHAVGGNRAWGENRGRRASSPPTVLRFEAFAYADLKNSARTAPRASADPAPLPRGSSEQRTAPRAWRDASERAPRELPERTSPGTAPRFRSQNAGRKHEALRRA